MTPIIGDAAALADRLSADFESEYRRVLGDGRRLTVALSGGSVATTCFPNLAALPVDWDRCEFFWADERAVPPADPESNYGLARSLWLDVARVPAARVHRMPADSPDLDAAALVYADVMARVVSPALDYVILGVGPDGHVASLFPGHGLLRETHQTVAAIHDAPKPPPRRMTLTLPALAGAGRVVVAAFGKAKAEVMREALTNTASALPVAMVLKRAKRPLVLLDKDAATS